MTPNRENVLFLMEKFFSEKNCGLTELSRQSGVKYDRLRDLRRGKQLTINAEDWDRLKHILIGNKENVPVIGHVPAGQALECIESIEPERYILYPDAQPHFFALRAQGESMNLVAPNGSFVIVDPTPRNVEELADKYVIANIDNEVTFKRLRLSPLRLEPYSSLPHETIFIENSDRLHIIGKVVGQFADLSEG